MSPAGGRSPLGELDQAFLALARRADPLTLPAFLVCEDPDQEAWPVDQVRSRLAHPSTGARLRGRTWREVVRRARTFGEPWTVVALGMAAPAVRRMLARLVRPAHLERAELEQEALVALAVALHSVDMDADELDRELFRAADRAVHRLVYAARRNAVRESGDAVHLGRLRAPAAALCGEAADEHSVLARAVQARVVDVAEAQLIARTRLGGEPMHRIAAERGVSVRQLYRHRTAAEGYLATYLRRQLHDDEE
jgi:hypothetical protein